MKTYTKTVTNSMYYGQYFTYRLSDGRVEILSDPRAIELFECWIHREGFRKTN